MADELTGSPQPILELSAITRDFEEGQVRALRGIDLAVKRGDYCAIMGRSGSGKSTLLNVLGLIDRPTTGAYRVEGVDTARMRSAESTRFEQRPSVSSSRRSTLCRICRRGRTSSSA